MIGHGDCQSSYKLEPRVSFALSLRLIPDGPCYSECCFHFHVSRIVGNCYFLIVGYLLWIWRPRWLHNKGKREEARRVLAQLHSSTGDINSPLVILELEEIEERVAVEREDRETGESFLDGSFRLKDTGRREILVFHEVHILALRQEVLYNFMRLDAKALQRRPSDE